MMAIIRDYHCDKPKCYYCRITKPKPNKQRKKMPETWSNAEIDFLKNNFNSMPSEMIAKCLSRARRTINKKILQLQLGRKPRVVIGGYKQGVPMAQADRFNGWY